MFKNSMLLLLIGVLLYNCTVQFDSNVRVESVGTVIDQNNAALANVNVGVYTETGRFTGFYPTIGANNQYLLGSGLSDENGNFSVVSLFDSDQDFFIFVDGGTMYTSYIYSANTYEFQPENHLFNLGEVQLKKKAIVNLNISRTSAPGATIDLTINYKSPFCESVIVNGVLDEALSNCFSTESIFKTLNDETPEFSSTLNSFVTGTIELIYSINGGTQITETFIIDQDNYEFNFSY